MRGWCDGGHDGEGRVCNGVSGRGGVTDKVCEGETVVRCCAQKLTLVLRLSDDGGGDGGGGGERW